MNSNKKQAVILIFVGLLLGIIGFNIPIASIGEGNASVGSVSLPVGTIASTILVSIGCFKLYRETSKKVFITSFILLIVSVVTELIISFSTVASIFTTLDDLFSYLEARGDNVELSTALIQMLDVLLDRVLLMMILLVIPTIIRAIMEIKLSSGLGEVAQDPLLGNQVKSNGKKMAIFKTIIIGIAIIFMVIFVNVFMGLMEEATVDSSGELFTGATPLGMLFLFFVVFPALMAFAIISIIFTIKYLISVGKLIKDVDMPLITEDNNIIDENTENSDEDNNY